MIVLRQKQFDEKEKEKPSKKKQLTGAGVGSAIGSGIMGGKYLLYDKKRIAKKALEEDNSRKTYLQKLEKVAERRAKSPEMREGGEMLLKDIREELKNINNGTSSKLFKKAANKKALKRAAIPVAIATAAGLAKSRGELDKDHIKASLSTDPGQIVAGHVGINKGDEALERNLKEGKTQAQAIRDSSEEAGKTAKKISRITSPIGGVVAGVSVAKSLKYLPPQINNAVGAIEAKYGEDMAKKAAGVIASGQRNRGKVGFAVGTLATLSGLGSAKVIGKRAEKISQRRSLKKLAEEDDNKKK